MSEFSPTDPLPVLRLEYERRFADAVTRGWLRAGLWILTALFLLHAGDWAFFYIVTRFMATPSISVWLALNTLYWDVLRLFLLVGAWILCGFDWSGTRRRTPFGWATAGSLTGLVALFVIRSLPELLRVRPTQFGGQTAAFWEACQGLYWFADTALLVQIVMVLKGFRSRMFVALGIGASFQSALRLILLAIPLWLGPNLMTFVRTHSVLWQTLVLLLSGADVMIGILLAVSAWKARPNSPAQG